MTSQLNVDTIVDKAGSGGSNVKMANTSTYVLDSGTRTQNLVEGLIKCFINYEDNASITDSLNFSSLIDGGTGIHSPVFTSQPTHSNYTTIGSAAGYHEHCIFAGRNTANFPTYGRENDSNSTSVDINGMIIVVGEFV